MYKPRSGSLMIAAVVVLLAVGMLVSSGYAGIDPGTVVGIWLFDEASGDAVKDSSGNGHDGNKDGSIKWADGQIDTALEFPGDTGDYVSIPHDDSLSLNTWTITVWINLQPNEWQLIIQKSISGQKNNNNYSLYPTPDGDINFNFYTAGGDANILDGNAIVVDENWHHVATTYDGKVMYLYIDGELDAEMDTGAEPILHSDPLVIGGDDRGAGVQVKGLVDEAGLFNKALSQADIKSIMDDGLKTATSVSLAENLAATWGGIKKHNE